MAQLSATPKTRSRRDGAAVPLDDLDKRLLNLMQGNFPLAPRPYEHVAGLAEVSEDEVLRRQRDGRALLARADLGRGAGQL